MAFNGPYVDRSLAQCACEFASLFECLCSCDLVFFEFVLLTHRFCYQWLVKNMWEAEYSGLPIYDTPKDVLCRGGACGGRGSFASGTARDAGSRIKSQWARGAPRTTGPSTSTTYG